jgi:peptidoglycan/LPS O-acetylase OafA/YrhL
MSLQKKLYFENLDGLRAIAAFAVIFAHLSYWFKYPQTEFYKSFKLLLSFDEAGGRLGVIFFFVLSGFLITYLLFAEQEKNKKINVIFFYIRRILRIWPLYFITLIIGFVIYPIYMHFSGIDFFENSRWWMFALFLANFDHIYHAFPSTNILGVQWSVSVEEQFYLLWPLIFVLFNRRNYFPYILVTLVVLSELFSVFVAYRLNAGDYHLLACLKYLSLGALLAYFCFYKTEKVLAVLNKIKKWQIVLIYIVCIPLLFMQHFISDQFELYKRLYHILPLFFFGFVIVEQNFSENSFFKIGKFPLLSWLGRISYGLYLTHMIALNIVVALFTNGEEYVLLKNVLTILITVLISYFSYHTIEKYFLSLKNKFSFEN